MMKKFVMEHKQMWVFLYGLIYFPWFFWLESRHVMEYHLIDASLDSMIPFCEYFIIPYLFWFVYMGGAMLVFLLTEPKEEFYKLTGFLFIGMTVCLVIYTVWPNIQVLRPHIDPEKNVFTRLVAMIYRMDTSTNVFPSIHVFSTIGVHIAIRRSTYAKKYSWVEPASAVAMVLIILSTVFLKQHSTLDVMAAMLLASVMYTQVYRTDFGEEGYRLFSGDRRKNGKPAKA